MRASALDIGSAINFLGAAEIFSTELEAVTGVLVAMIFLATETGAEFIFLFIKNKKIPAAIIIIKAEKNIILGNLFIIHKS